MPAVLPEELLAVALLRERGRAGRAAVTAFFNCGVLPTLWRTTGVLRFAARKHILRAVPAVGTPTAGTLKVCTLMMAS